MAVRRVGGADGSSGDFVQPCRPGGVVSVPVRDQDEFHGTGSGQLLKVGLVERARVHDDGGRMAGPAQ